ARAGFRWDVFGYCVEAVADSTAQFADPRRFGAMFINQTALLGLEILDRVFVGGKHVGVVEISESASVSSTLRVHYRPLDYVNGKQRLIIEPQFAGVIGGFFSPCLHFALAGAGSGFDQIRTGLGAAKLD